MMLIHRYFGDEHANIGSAQCVVIVAQFFFYQLTEFGDDFSGDIPFCALFPAIRGQLSMCGEWTQNEPSSDDCYVCACCFSINRRRGKPQPTQRAMFGRPHQRF